MDESKRVVPYSRGQALADEFGIQFFETSAKSNLKVEEVRHFPVLHLLCPSQVCIVLAQPMTGTARLCVVALLRWQAVVA